MTEFLEWFLSFADAATRHPQHRILGQRSVNYQIGKKLITISYPTLFRRLFPSFFRLFKDAPVPIVAQITISESDPNSPPGWVIQNTIMYNFSKWSVWKSGKIWKNHTQWRRDPDGIWLSSIDMPLMFQMDPEKMFTPEGETLLALEDDANTPSAEELKDLQTLLLKKAS